MGYEMTAHFQKGWIYLLTTEYRLYTVSYFNHIPGHLSRIPFMCITGEVQGVVTNGCGRNSWQDAAKVCLLKKEKRKNFSMELLFGSIPWSH